MDIAIVVMQDDIPVTISATVFAQSAFDNDIDTDSFKASLDNFSHLATSDLETIQKWRDSATDIYFDLMEKAGKIKFNPVEFYGGSDFSDDEDDPSDANKN